MFYIAFSKRTSSLRVILCHSLIDNVFHLEIHCNTHTHKACTCFAVSANTGDKFIHRAAGCGGSRLVGFTAAASFCSAPPPLPPPLKKTGLESTTTTRNWPRVTPKYTSIICNAFIYARVEGENINYSSKLQNESQNNFLPWSPSWENRTQVKRRFGLGNLRLHVNPLSLCSWLSSKKICI